MEQTENLIPDSFDEFMNPDVKTTPDDIKENEVLISRLAAERNVWTAKIKNMSSYLQSVLKISDLQVMIYTERQMASEYHHYLVTLFIKLNRLYRKIFAEKYEFYSYKSQKRFPNENTKTNQILSEMAELVEKREMMDNHIKFMESTIKSIDNIIYGIKSRIEIEQIAKGK